MLFRTQNSVGEFCHFSKIRFLVQANQDLLLRRFMRTTLPSNLSSRLIEPPLAATRATAQSATITFYSDDKQMAIASGLGYWSGSLVHLDLQEEAAYSGKRSMTRNGGMIQESESEPRRNGSIGRGSKSERVLQRSNIVLPSV